MPTHGTLHSQYVIEPRLKYHHPVPISPTFGLNTQCIAATGVDNATLNRNISGNVVPLGRSMSDILRLQMAGAQLTRAASRRPDELGGLVDAMLFPWAEDGPRDLRSSC